MEDSEPAAHILDRGQYDLPGERVTPNVPKALPPLPADKKPDRLVLANWLINPDNPLTARVTVNRFWQELFGTGIVKTSEDFGSQGERPSHPELLDWLAAEFIECDWDIKHMYKIMMLSSTYRQSSRLTPELISKDPENRLLARGPRFRLDAEVIRDQTLFLSESLVAEVGGAPVKPYQPSESGMQLPTPAVTRQNLSRTTVKSYTGGRSTHSGSAPLPHPPCLSLIPHHLKAVRFDVKEPIHPCRHSSL